jgi:hypothetical protein
MSPPPNLASISPPGPGPSSARPRTNAVRPYRPSCASASLNMQKSWTSKQVRGTSEVEMAYPPQVGYLMHQALRKNPNGSDRLSFKICIYLQNGHRLSKNVENEDLKVCFYSGTLSCDPLFSYTFRLRTYIKEFFFAPVAGKVGRGGVHSAPSIEPSRALRAANPGAQLPLFS